MLFSFYGEGEHKRKKTVAVADTAVQLANALACKALAKYFSINDAQTLKRKNKQKKKTTNPIRDTKWKRWIISLLFGLRLRLSTHPSRTRCLLRARRGSFPSSPLPKRKARGRGSRDTYKTPRDSSGAVSPCPLPSRPLLTGGVRPLGAAATGSTWPPAPCRRKCPHLGPVGQHGGCIICRATPRSSALKYIPLLSPPTSSPPASGSGHQPRICSDAPGSPAPVQKQGLICRLAPR